MSEKICMFCSHLWNEPYYQYSTMTDGGGYMSCCKNHWMWSHSDSLEEFRAKILIAEKCKDYDEAKP